MIKFELYKNRKTANIVIDKTNLKEKDARGIRRVAQKVCKDVERVTGVCPVIGESLCRTENEVVVAVLGKTSDTDGALAAELIAEMQMDVSSIRGKRESFLFVVTEQRQILFIQRNHLSNTGDFLSMMSGRHLETGHFLILVVSQPKCTI